MITEIPFRRIPHQSALFLSYLESSPAALRFYQHAPTIENVESAARSVQNLQFKRNEIVSILRRQNESYGCDSATLDRINDIEKPDCAAIVTGQQVGLFTGPLYTVFKAMTAIQMSTELKKKGIRAVPIFWMETEDHDLAEVARRTVLNPDSSLQSIDYRGLLFDSGATANNASVGSVQFPERIVQALQDYLSHLPDGKGRPGVESLLQKTFKPGNSFAQSFAESMALIFKGTGLILFDPRDAEAKRLNSATFLKAVQEEDAIRIALVQRNKELEDSGFHSQVSVLENSTVLFFIENGERRALERKGPGFALKNTNRVFTPDELMAETSRNPEKFSPNVLLRPLIQDHLFPTVAYVGGSSELAYFAQIQVLYRLFGRPMPVIWPRNSFTLVEPEVGSEMDRLGIELEDCFTGKQFLTEKSIRTSGSSQAWAEIDGLGEYLDSALTEVKAGLQALEPPLAQALETARRKILYNVQHLKSRAIRSEETVNSSTPRSVDFVLHHIYPNMNLQERELGIYYFLARHGPSVLGAIRSAIIGSRFEHRIIRLR